MQRVHSQEWLFRQACSTEQRIRENEWIQRMTRFTDKRAAHYKAKNSAGSAQPVPEGKLGKLKDKFEETIPYLP